VRVETVYGWVGRFGLLVASVAAGFAVLTKFCLYYCQKAILIYAK